MKRLVAPLSSPACAALSLTACSSDAGASSDEPGLDRGEEHGVHTGIGHHREGRRPSNGSSTTADSPTTWSATVDLDGKLKSELLTEGTFSYTFDDAGTFTYHCTPHPMMVGTVIVEG